MIPLPTPFPVGDINSYLITADPVTIIDPGLYYQPAEDSLRRALEQNGLNMSDIRRIVITHGHHDHYGMAGKIQSESGAEVLVRDEEVIKMVPDREYMDSMNRTILTTGITKEILEVLANHRETLSLTHPIESIRPFSGEISLEFSDFKIRLLHMPGHSGGHTCLYWEEEKVLLSGDVLLPDITSIPLVEYDPGERNFRRRSLADIIGSMKRISEMRPRLCLPGHGGSVSDPGNLADSRVEFHMSRLEEIFNIVPEKKENGMTPYQLSRKYFPDVQDFDKFLAVIEVVSHLDWLADEGRIGEHIDEGGVSYFYRVA
jgi:glyoxylase-like metal-dependent hydrolase (beta-lactamase superfamily II)